ncbi:SMI1 / KNR4 family protein [Shimia sp. SK013]|uniref:SMI1/KNR4 family protein n=1 Tax=Shimia sp. SK013 TaxID=1389006 RepID=UPI0006B62622|nr:SMI1/KNR4 family protein [Shimia sp. SK013]KPA20803.1 SMI1 / KNR4 family protein [Shimia sp. SK013]
MSALQVFADRWSVPNYPPEKVFRPELVGLEAEIGVRLPEDDLQQVLSTGLPRPTTDLWDWVDKRSFWNRLSERTGWKVLLLFATEVPHISDFFSPPEVLQALNWRGRGMPDRLVPFANDSLGNLICFSYPDISNGEPTMPSVVIWDHEFGQVEALAENFTEFLRLYL